MKRSIFAVALLLTSAFCASGASAGNLLDPFGLFEVRNERVYRNALVGGAIGTAIGAPVGYAHCGPACGWGGAAIGFGAGTVIGVVLSPLDAIANPRKR